MLIITKYVPAAGGGGSSRTFVTKTADFTMLGSEDIIRIDADGGSLTVTFPDPAPLQGKEVTLARIDGNGDNSVNFAGPGPSVISQLQITQSVTMISDGTIWIPISRF